MNKIYKAFSLLLALILVISMVPISSVAVVENRIYSTTTAATAGQEVSVPIYIQNNTGIAGFRIVMNYDSRVLEPVSVSTTGTVLSGIVDDSIETSLAGSFEVVLSGTTNSNSDGLLYIATFNVSPDAGDSTTISVSYKASDTINDNIEEVALSCEDIDLAITGGTGDYEKNQGITIALGDKAIDGDTVTIPVSISNNTGIMGYKLRITFDPAVISLTNIQNSGLFTGIFTTNLSNISSHPTYVDILWNNTSSIKENGKLFDLVFTKVGGDTDVIDIGISYVPEETFTEGSGSTYTPVKIICVGIHQFDKQVVAPEYLKSEATCTEAAVYYYSCECGEVGTETFVSGSALGHTWNSGKVTKAATCTAAGVKTYTCTVCGETKTETIAKKSHSYSSSYTVDKKATLKADGSKSKHCTVCDAKASVTAIPKVSTVKLSKTSYTYDGKAKKPTVTVTDSKGNTLKSGTDYKVTYASGRTKAGTYKVTVTGIGNYDFTKTLTFTINPIRINPTVKLTTISYTYDGEAKKPSVIVKDSKGNTLKENTDYTITYPSSCKEVGKYTVVVNGKGNYLFTKKLTFEIKEDTTTAIFDKGNIVRTYGDTRYQTSIKTADALKTTLGVDKFDTIIVAYGRNFADALAGSYLAAVKSAPILVVNTETDMSKTNQDDFASMKLVKNYINDNLSKNGTVYILGGTAVISDDYMNTLKASGRTVKRLAGENRYETNIAILKEAGFSGGDLLVSDAYGYADALSASSLGKPILLIDKSSGKLNDTQKAYLKSVKSSVKNVYMIGGTAAVPSSIQSDIKSIASSAKFTRFAGANRYETSKMIADKFFANPKAIVVAYGHNFPDGLCGGPLANALGAPLLLTYPSADNSAFAKSYAKANTSIKYMAILGGQGSTENPQLTNDLINSIKSGKIVENKY